MFQLSPQSHSLVRLAPALLALYAVAPHSVHAQKATGAETVTGKLVSIEKKGRNATLTVETAEKETKEFQLTARAKLEITAAGDDGFLTKGQFVSTQAVKTNNKLFAKKFSVHVGPGRKVGGVAKPPKKPGVSLAAWNVAGQITDRGKDKEFPEYEIIALRAGRQTVPVFLDKGYSVTVLLSDVTLAEPGSTVTIEGKPGRRNRFTVTAAKIELADPLKSEEFLKDDKAPRKRRTTKTKTPSKAE